MPRLHHKEVMTPTKADFDNAVKQPWRTRTCLVAQMMKRLNIPLGSPALGRVDHFADKHEGLRAMMLTFDRYFENPGDESKAPLVALREQLPA